MKKVKSADKMFYNGPTARDIIKRTILSKTTKIVHDEGYFTYQAFEKNKKIYINEFTYDAINHNWFNKTVCEVVDGKDVKYEILKEIYGE